MDITHTRNFCIIAHIDHGKSTLADRLLLLTGAIDERKFREQVLDDMELERERGITIKASYVRLRYRSQDGEDYHLNLVDTPGHVDFSFEVTKSLQACEGAVLVVDAGQGVEAQTVANHTLAQEMGMTIVPVINKIDLANADPERVARELKSLLQLPDAVITYASAKDGRGVTEILERIVREIPAPVGKASSPLAALIFDSRYDAYKGVVVYVRIISGSLKRGMSITLMGSAVKGQVQEVGILTPQLQEIAELSAGDVGYLAANLRNPRDVVAGDTVTETKRPADKPLPGFKHLKPMVFAGIYPSSAQDIGTLRMAMEKLLLTDAAFTFEPEQSEALGPGFRCGFLGLLHMDIVQERLEREYGVHLVLTTPSVVYQVTTQQGKTVEVHRPSDLPPPSSIRFIAEPFVEAVILSPPEALGPIMELAIQKRGVYKSTEYLSENRAKLIFNMPLSEILVEFYDRLKSLTRGYGSFDYTLTGYQASQLVRLDILLNSRPCEPLSMIVAKSQATEKGRLLVARLKNLIPRQLFEVVIQAAIGGKILARESIRPLAKNVTSKCYGGDITRKRKLWDRQREGKRRMKHVGNVEIPQEAFLAMLKV